MFFFLGMGWRRSKICSLYISAKLTQTAKRIWPCSATLTAVSSRIRFSSSDSKSIEKIYTQVLHIKRKLSSSDSKSTEKIYTQVLNINRKFSSSDSKSTEKIYTQVLNINGKLSSLDSKSTEKIYTQVLNIKRIFQAQTLNLQRKELVAGYYVLKPNMLQKVAQ